MAIRHTFKVYERLKREQQIYTLFQTGKAFSVFPLRFIYIVVPRIAKIDSPVLAGFSVPKKKFKSSVLRHRIRRLIVESWRLNKHLLYEGIPEDKQMHIFFIYTDTKLPDYTTVNVALNVGLDKLKVIAAALSS